MQVDTGQLSLANYLGQLRSAIPAEKARSKALKEKGAIRQALDAFKHAQIMENELKDALNQDEQSL